MSPDVDCNTEVSDNNMNKVGAEVKNDNEIVRKDGCCKSCTDKIILTLENCFESLGYFVASNPIKVILIALFVTALCLIGMIGYFSENRGEKLWVSSESESLKHQEWVSGEYPAQSRIVTVIAESSNILTPAGLKGICEIDTAVKLVKNGTDSSWDLICLRRGPFCSTRTVLDLWGNNCTYVKLLDQNTILADVNANQQLLNFNLFLGEISYDNGQIKEAKATKMMYFLKNQEVEKEGNRVDKKGEGWEVAFTNVFANGFTGFDNVWTSSRAGNREESGTAIGSDLKFLFVGYVLIIIYLSVMLGSFSKINHKVWLAICGVLCIGLSIGIAYGLSSAFQLFVTPVHNVLPFLLLGIGVDDVFVIIQNWDNIGGSTNNDDPIPDNIAKAIRHAGVSILVTSFTDICAFLIGATTILPALRSFCIFAGIGVLAVFILTCTFFVAFLALDSKRQRDRRDACCCCIKLSDDWEPLQCSKNSYLQHFMKNAYSKAILSTPGRVIVLIVWAGLLAVGAYGLSQLKQDFDPDWFLPPDSKALQYNKANDKYFSVEGIQSAVYVGDVDYFAYQDNLKLLSQHVDNNKYVVTGSTQSWYLSYLAWLPTNNATLDADGKPQSEVDFYNYLSQFLSTQGAQFTGDLKRKNDVLQSIRASRIRFTHVKLEGAANEIQAMDSIQDAVTPINFSPSKAFAYTRFYIGWETNKVISEELIRNLVLAGVVVFIVTLFLIANVWVSLMVLSCVGFTLINIAGFMHFWGLTVDTVTTINLIIAIGLSVDYSAHIGHAFMASRKGNRIERASNALEEIGPAVVNGGFSTFLAFVFLAGSVSYVFSAFFKLFFLVVVFGLFHGIVYLPVLLSLVGPDAYTAHTPDEKGQEMSEPKNTEEDPSDKGIGNEAYIHSAIVA